MAANLVINAEVVDISSDAPRAKDVFFVDTNVWYWLTYTKASQAGARNFQLIPYPAYINKILGVGSDIFYSGLSVAELTHLVEKAEREIYAVANGPVGTKEFRHNYAAERNSIVLEVVTACSQMMSLSKSLDTVINEATCQAALSRFASDKVDGYDLFILESMKNNGINQIVTDDGDFATIKDIRVFTSNRNVLQAAATQGKLIVR